MKEGEEGEVLIQVARAENGMPDGKVLWEGRARQLATKRILKWIEEKGQGE